MNNDKKTEYLRYEKRAHTLLSDVSDNLKPVSDFGAHAIPPVYRSPYIFYEKCINKYVNSESDVLEIGAGTGLHTSVIKETGARVVATDISSQSLELLSQKIKGVKTSVADMERLPFESQSFDIVTSAGSLSYGEPDLVDSEIRRVLRPGGIFICVDSLNHNPVYRLNRWVHYKRGERTRSTLLRMPTISRIQSILSGFQDADIRFFGAISYLTPFLARIIGQNNAAKLSDAIDRIAYVRRMAFKFVLVARERL